MSHNPSNYLQNYQNYYQSAPDQYDDYYEDETQDLKQNYDDVPPDLQVPNSKLYAEGYSDDNELYATNDQFVEPQQQVENTNLQYRHDYNIAPNDYYYTDPQPHYHHRTRVPKSQPPPPIQTTSSFRYLLPHSVYPSCPLATSSSQQGTALTHGATSFNQGTILNPATALDQGVCLNQGECSYIPKAGIHGYQGTGRNLSKTHGVSNLKIVGENYNALQGYNEKFDQNQRTAYQNADNYEDFNDNERMVYENQEYYDLNQGKAYQTQENYDQNQVKAYQTPKNYVDYSQGQTNTYQSPENFGDYCNVGARAGFVGQYGAKQFVEYKGKRFSYYGNKVVGKSANMKKYPVTVKTPKFVNKNQVAQLVHKRPSALCLPQVTQPDPGLVRRKSKTHHNLKKPYDQSEPLSQNPSADPSNYSYSAHQIHSEGDMNQNSMAQGLDSLLDQFENKMGLHQNTGDGLEGEEHLSKIKEFSKFLKPRVPSSIRAKQDRIAKMKSSTGSLQPKMKLSLDKLLNRLQKCELSESTEKLSIKSSKSKNLDEKEDSTESKTIKHKSFNYETLARKLSPRMEDPGEESESIPNKPSTSLTTSLDHKKSSRLIRPLDDNCAIDLHRSKSYIVDLIDRALSKELGTVPRGPVEDNMTPKQAVTTISRNRQTCQKELCYEVTAALTDSFISNATAPPSKQDVLSQALKRCESDDCGAKKLCKPFNEDVDYIKQLKQLRWGHIRHIQHEARKLADLEEFLEKCGEIDY